MKRLLLILLLIVLTACSGNYEEKSSDVTDEMLDISSEAKLIIDQYTDVWSASITNGGAFLISEISALTGLDEDDVNEHFDVTEINTIVADFSSNVNAIKSYHESEGNMKKLKSDMKEVKKSVQELNNPKGKYKDLHGYVLDMYNATNKLVELAIEPTGSLNEFNDQKNELINDIESLENKINILVKD